MAKKNGLAAATNSAEQKSKLGKELAQKRWKMAEQSDEELKQLFQTTPLKDAFETLYTMRRQCEIAAKILEDRNSTEKRGEFCANPACNLKFTDSIRPYTIKPVRDPKSLTVSNAFFCSLGCQAAVEKGLNRPEAVIAQK